MVGDSQGILGFEKSHWKLNYMEILVPVKVYVSKLISVDSYDFYSYLLWAIF